MRIADQQRLLAACRAVLAADSQPMRAEGNEATRDETAAYLLRVAMAVQALRQVVMEIEAQR